MVDRPDELILACELSEVPDASPAINVTFPFVWLPVCEPVFIGALKAREPGFALKPGAPLPSKAAAVKLPPFVVILLDVRM
jgi:hypothetical protein